MIESEKLELVRLFRGMPPASKAKTLARIAEAETVNSRVAYSFGNKDIEAMRSFNEFVHRLLGYIRVVLDADERWLSDETMIESIIETLSTRGPEALSELMKTVHSESDRVGR